MDFQTNSAQKMACSNDLGFSNDSSLSVVSSVASAAVAAGVTIGSATQGIRNGAQLPVAAAGPVPLFACFLSGVWGMLLIKYDDA